MNDKETTEAPIMFPALVQSYIDRVLAAVIAGKIDPELANGILGVLRKIEGELSNAHRLVKLHQTTLADLGICLNERERHNMLVSLYIFPKADSLTGMGSTIHVQGREATEQELIDCAKVALNRLVYQFGAHVEGIDRTTLDGPDAVNDRRDLEKVIAGIKATRVTDPDSLEVNNSEAEKLALLVDEIEVRRGWGAYKDDQKIV